MFIPSCFISYRYNIKGCPSIFRPMGYQSPVLTFNENDPYPTASMCAVKLSLPTKYDEYEVFKNSMNTAFTMHGGFGLI